MLHLFVSLLKMVNRTPAIWLASICLSVASSIFFFSSKTWMVVENDTLGPRQDSFDHMFWLMTFYESASFIGSQVLGNYLIDGDVNKNIRSTWNVAVVLVVVAIIYVTGGWKEAPKRTLFKDYSIVFHRHVLCDKRIWLVSLAQASVHFSVTAFWILWAPTVVRGYFQNYIGNSALTALSALGMFSAAGCCMHVLKKMGKAASTE